jgi:DNA-binding response OmpR family regulator
LLKSCSRRIDSKLHNFRKLVFGATIYDMGILIIEDDQHLLHSIESCLQAKGFETFTANDLESAILHLGNSSIRVIVSDIVLKSDNALSLIDYIKGLQDPPALIFITAYADKDIILHSINNDVFRFLEKPIRLETLVQYTEEAIDFYKSQRVQSASQRLMKFDTKNNGVYIDGREYKLTEKEFRILYLLKHKNGEWVSKKIILDKIWQSSPNLSRNTIDTHIYNIRKKIPSVAPNIVSHRGKGYRFEINPCPKD